MNIDLLCMGCMNEKPQPGRCPHCGYVEEDWKEYHQLRPRTILNGKYLVGRALGEGGFGITYLGWDLNLDLKLAIKEYCPVDLVVRDSTQSGLLNPLSGERGDYFSQGKEKFIDEARRLAKCCNLPGVVGVRDFFQENGTAYIVMEFVDGITLKKYLELRGGTLSPEELLPMFKPLLESLEQVHQAGIIHRDISPDNIMVEKDGRLRLLDFGAARDVNKAQGEKSLSVIVKGGYAPLEQYSSTSRKGTYSDIYSIGAVLYFVLTSTKPMDATIRTMENMPEPKALDPGIPEEANRAIMRAMSLKPDERQQDAESFMEDLLGESPLPDRPARKTDRHVRQGRNKWLLWILVGTGCILLSGGGVLVSRKISSEKESDQKANADIIRYEEMIQHARSIRNNQDSLLQACLYLREAEKLEDLYAGTEFASRFDADAGSSIVLMEKQIDSLFSKWKSLAMDSYEAYREWGDAYEKGFALEYIRNALSLKDDNELKKIKSLLEK